MSEVAKRRWRSLLILRRLLTCAIAAIALMALLVHVEEVTKLPADASYKLPTQHETGYQKLSQERSRMEEIAPPHLLEDPLTAHKI